MNIMRTAAVRRTARAIMEKIAAKRQAQYSVVLWIREYVPMLLASIACGLVLASFLSSSHHTDVSPASNATQSVAAQSAQVEAPEQSNPLFAVSPSWSQNFQDQKTGLPDSKYWNVLVGPAQNSNKEQQYYTADAANLRVENGTLRLIATHEQQPGGYEYGSARLETQGKQTFLYGRVDITAKLPRGSGTWPAIWFLPANNVYANKSPENDSLRYRNGGEIDVMEAVGFQPDVIYGVAHTLSDLQLRSDGTGSFGTVQVPGSSSKFATYTLLWTPTRITFAVNGKEFATYARKAGADYTTWPFDQPFYLVVNLAMGGTWGGLDTAHFPKNGIDDAALPTSLDIQSIYYYPYVGDKTVK